MESCGDILLLENTVHVLSPRIDTARAGAKEGWRGHSADPVVDKLH